VLKINAFKLATTQRQRRTKACWISTQQIE